MKPLLLLLAGVSLTGFLANSGAAAPKHYNIPPQPLPGALQQFALQGGEQIMFTPQGVSGKHSKGVAGTLEPEAALHNLLDGTGTSYQMANGVYVVAMQTLAPTPAATVQPVAGQASDNAPAATGGFGLEEIVVTAQKRTENLQETPLAISALTAATIEAQGISTISNLAATAPSLNVTQTAAPGTASIFIRGQGTSEPILTADSPVALYIDGIIIGRSTGSVFDVAELERIEVLRGPQGTLYGRNTIGGAINLITRKPGDEFGVRQKLSVGNYGYWQSRTSIDTGELGDSGLRAMLTYLHKERNGYVDNLNQPKDSRDPGAYNNDAARLAVTFDQGGLFRANYSLSYNHSKAIAHPTQVTVARPDVIAAFANSQAAGGDPFIVSPERLGEVRYDAPALFYDKVWGHTLGVEVDLGDDLTLRSLTGYRKWKQTDVDNELDGQGRLYGSLVGQGGVLQRVTLFNASSVRQQHQWSQEINLLGKVGESFEYVLGGYYFREKARENNPQTFGIVTAGGVLPLRSTLDYEHISQTKALFVQGTFGVTEKLNLTGGARYTWDKKDFKQTMPMARESVRDFKKFNWAVSADYEVNDDTLAYARIATGYKAGGFNPRSANADGFQPENLTSYEIGFKSDLFDRRLRFNTALFYAQHKDVQVSQFQAGSGGATSITTNAGKADYKGVEVELTAVPVNGLTATASFGYIDRDYKTFVVRNPSTNQLVDIAKTGQARFAFSPSTTFHGSVEYKFPPFTFGQLAARLDYNYRSEVGFNASPFGAPFHDAITAGSRGLLDARLTLSEFALGRTDLSVSLWGRNITGKDYRVMAIDFGSVGFATNVYGEPATYGLDVTINF